MKREFIILGLLFYRFVRPSSIPPTHLVSGDKVGSYAVRLVGPAGYVSIFYVEGLNIINIF